MSIRRRMLAGLLAGLAAVLAGAGAAIYVSARHALVSDFDRLLAARAAAVASMVENENGTLAFDSAAHFLPDFEGGSDPDYFQVRTDDGRTFKRSTSLQSLDLPLRTGTLEQPAFWNLQLPSGREGRAAGVKFAAREESADGSAVRPIVVSVVVAISRARLDETLGTLLAIIVLVCVAAMAAAAVIVVRVLARGLQPLDVVSETAAQIDVRRMQTRFATTDMPAELAPICSRLNELLDRFQAGFERERRFTANLAHELRTPIAELRAMAEVAIAWPPRDGQGAAGMADVLDISLQMQAVVNTLLTLARCQAGTQAPRLEAVAIASLVDDAWQANRRAAAEKQLAVRIDVDAAARVVTDGAMLGVIVANLVGNAVQYTPARGEVGCTLEAAGAGARLVVRNTTAGLSADDVPRLTEPFWRKDSAHADSAHSGLGLTLASDLAGVLGLELAARLEEGGMLHISIGPLLPAPAETKPQNPEAANEEGA